MALHKGSQEINGITYKYSSDWIHRLENPEHWLTYRQQLGLILPALQEGDHILEIGPGSGFLSNYLRNKGYQVHTLDIDPEKKPDIVANVVTYDFPQAYDHILAFEVFEHIPYEEFEKVLGKIRKSVRKNIFLSVPRNYRIWFQVRMTVPLFKQLGFTLKAKRRKIQADHHFWELDYRDYSQEKLVASAQQAGFKAARHLKQPTVCFMQLEANA